MMRFITLLKLNTLLALNCKNNCIKDTGMKNLILLFICGLLHGTAVQATAAETTLPIMVAGTSQGLRDFKQEDIEIGIRSAFNDELIKQGLSVDFKMYKSIEELETPIKNKKLDFFFGSSIELLSLESLIDKERLLAGLVNGKHKMRLYLLVRKDTPIKNIQALANKTIDIPSWLLNDIGAIYLNTYLMENNLATMDSFFSTVQKSKNSNQSIINLFFKKNDAALVTESEFEIATELNPQISAQITILQSSDTFTSFICAGLLDTEKSNRETMYRTALGLSKTSKGRSTLKLMHSSGFVPIAYEELSNVKTLMLKYQRLKSRKTGT